MIVNISDANVLVSAKTKNGKRVIVPTSEICKNLLDKIFLYLNHKTIRKKPTTWARTEVLHTSFPI